MTEHDLYEYLRQQRKIKRLRAEFKECEVFMTSPKSPNITGVAGGNEDDKLDKLIDRRNAINKKIEECVALRDVAERMLDRVSELLDNELTENVFNMLYRKGHDIDYISRELSYSKAHIYRQRSNVLTIIARL